MSEWGSGTGMLTPVFDATQDPKFVHISVRLPYVKAHLTTLSTSHP